MKQGNFFLPALLLVWGMSANGPAWAQPPPDHGSDIYTGYYSREGNFGEMAKSSGNSHFVKFYPDKRFVRLYIPYPYSEQVAPEAINAAFAAAFKSTTGSAYIRDKFDVMEQPVIAHIDSYRVVEGTVMYDCGKAKPCRVVFDAGSMNEVKPGIVMEHNIPYVHVKD